MQVIVGIDTAQNSEIKVSLTIDGKTDEKVYGLQNGKAQLVLPMLDELLKKHQLTIKDIAGITVNTGPGSFTGLRVGIAIANTLGYLLQVPINDKKVGEQVDAVYE